MNPLLDFYLSALGAVLANAPETEFSARMASFYCRMILALEVAQNPSSYNGE